MVLGSLTVSLFAQLRPLGCRWVSVDTDEFGMIPKCLREALSGWKPSDINDAKSRAPKFMYVNPTGGNPTGTTMTMERKREIYQVCDLVLPLVSILGLRSVICHSAIT